MVTHSAQCTRQLSRQCVTVPLAHGAAGTLEYCSGIRPCHVKTDLGRRRILCKESFLRCQIFLACCDSGLARHMISRRPIARQVRRVFSSYSSQWHRWGLCLRRSLLSYVRGCVSFLIEDPRNKDHIQDAKQRPFPGCLTKILSRMALLFFALVTCALFTTTSARLRFWPISFKFLSQRVTLQSIDQSDAQTKRRNGEKAERQKFSTSTALLNEKLCPRYCVDCQTFLGCLLTCPSGSSGAQERWQICWDFCCLWSELIWNINCQMWRESACVKPHCWENHDTPLHYFIKA